MSTNSRHRSDRRLDEALGQAATAREPLPLALEVYPATVIKVLLTIIAGLLAMGLLLPSYPFWLGRESTSLGVLAARFDLDGEGNLPSYFSALQLLACGLALITIAVQQHCSRSRWRYHWALLACGFVYLSVDEAAQLHELMNLPTRHWLTERVDGAVWVIPALAIAAPVAIAYVPFLLALPLRIAVLTAGAGLIFLSGAAGMETVSSLYDATSLAYLGWMALEEAMEMIGIALFLYALLELLAFERRPVQLTVRG